MKKYIATGMLFLTLLLSTGVRANAEESILTVSATATETVSPDVTNITFAVETEATTAQAAADKNQINSQKLYRYLNGVISKTNGDSIKTTSFNVNPKYSYVNNKRELCGYIAKNTVTIKTKNIKEVGKIISGSLNNGANEVQNVAFSIDEESCYYEVLAKASKKAKEQAQTVALSLGVNIKGIKRVSSSYNSSFIRPYNYHSYEMVGAEKLSESAPMPIEAGDMKINGTVDIEFYLDNPGSKQPCGVK